MTTLLPIALGLLLQSTALLLLGLVAMRLARRRGPAVQSLIGRATLAGVGLALVLAGPLAGHIKPVWRVAVGEPTPRQVASPPETGGAGGKVVAKSRLLDRALLGQAPMGRVPVSGPLTRAPLTDPSPIIPVTHPTTFSALHPVSGGEATCRGVGSLWASGTALLLLWLALCQRHLTRLRRSARPVLSGPAAEILAALTTRPPALLTHPSVRSPFLAGLRRPAIFLLTTYEADFKPAALRAILAHELAHLARRDNAWTLAARLLSALLWPQPLLWALCRHLDQIDEEACDQAVLAQDCPARAYADCLLTLAQRQPLGRRERALGASVAPFRSSLGRRIGRILDKGTHAMSTVSARLRLTVAALTVIAALGVTFLVPSAPAQSPGPDTATSILEQQRLNATRLQDMSNLKQIGLALTQYAQDHNERFPNAAHWMDALSPYLKDKTVFFNPFRPGSRRYGYALNRNCSGKSLTAFAAPAETVIAFDSILGTRNASDTGQSLRATTLLRLEDVPGSSYLFVDGHVKWFHKSYLPSFAIKSDRRSSRLRSAHVTQGFVVQSYLGNRPVGPARVISEADMAARQNFLSSSAQPDPALSNARFLAGLTSIQGPGVVVRLNDSKRHISRKMPPGMASPNIIHDTDINQVVNELKAAGAEAIAVNDQRLVATSPVRCAGPTIFVNNMPMAPPFVIKAIGSPKALTVGLSIPGGIGDQIGRLDHAMFSVKQTEALRLPAYSGGSEPRYAKPASFHASPAADGKGAGETRVASSAGGTAGGSQAAKRQQKMRAGYSPAQTKWAETEQAFSQAKQGLRDEIRAALPQAPAETFAKAFNLETRIGRSISSLKNATEYYEALHRKEHNPKKYAGAAQWVVKAERELKPLLAEEANLFPRTEEVRLHLSSIHTLSVRLFNRRMELLISNYVPVVAVLPKLHKTRSMRARSSSAP